MRFYPLLVALSLAGSLSASDEYLRWDAKQAKSIALSQRVKGQVGKSLDFRIVHTEHSYNYKLRATWMTPEVIRASARLQQIAKGLSDDETRRLVAEAEAAGDTVIQVEIDPREGSGIIPNDWVAMLYPRSESQTPPRSVTGTSTPKLREVPALAGGAPRDYAYDIFWVMFPLLTPDGEPLFRSKDGEAELSVRIHNKVGKVHWQIPESIRARSKRVPR